MHLVSNNNEQTQRLYHAAKALRCAETKSDVALLLNVSPQNLTAWEDRGISSEGLLKAQEIIGCDAIWLRDGTGDMRTGKEALKSAIQGLMEVMTIYLSADSDQRNFILTAAKSVIDADSK